MSNINLANMVTAEIKAAALHEVVVGSIVAERTRRLSLGFDFDFGDARGVHHIGTSPADQAGWDEVSKLAGAMLALGETEAEIAIVTNTGPAVITALEWQMILIAAGQFRQPIWSASFLMQAADPMPEDITADALWP